LSLLVFFDSFLLSCLTSFLSLLECKCSSSGKSPHCVAGKAYDAATAAKAAADKSQKLALAKAKKAEKALADAEKEHRLREQAVAERLQTMSTAAEGTYSTFPLFQLLSIFLYFAKNFPSLLFMFLLLYRIHRGIIVDSVARR
jgi:hypothetical protein